MALHGNIYRLARWRRLRLKVLVEHPLCAVCGRPSSDVHHKQSIDDRPDLAFDEDNLMALCASCHSRLFTHLELAQRRGRKYRPKGCDVNGETVGGWLA